jgi:hypothetical protein
MDKRGLPGAVVAITLLRHAGKGRLLGEVVLSRRRRTDECTLRSYRPFVLHI